MKELLKAVNKDWKPVIFSVLILVIMSITLVLGSSSRSQKQERTSILGPKKDTLSFGAFKDVTIYSIKPYENSSRSIPVTEEKINNHPVFGKVRLDNTQRDALKQALKNSGNGTIAGCFEPQHAIKFNDGLNECLIVICYICGRYNFPKMVRPFPGEGALKVPI